MNKQSERANECELVSAIIPTYNCGPWIEEAIESVLNQTYENIEIIVVDDGSTDDTRQILDPYIEKNQIEYFYQENQGPAAARNTGIDKASGEYLAFLDADDIWIEEKTEKQLSILKRKPEVKLVIANSYLIDEKGKVKGKRINQIPNNFKKLIKKFFFSKILKNTPTIIANSTAVNSIDGFDEELPHREDHFFLMLMADKYKIEHCKEPLVKIRDRSGSMSRELLAKSPVNEVKKILRLKKPFISKSIDKFDFLEKYEGELISKYYSKIATRDFKRGYRRQAISLMTQAIKKFPKRWKNYLLLVLFLSPCSYKYVLKMVNWDE